ncbi:MAG: glycosyltransferase family 2 protein [Candidatus Aureabacteria bacterium]|nr:glycosyltransferase family 2 protein [Candidatus Auribacterota bacterium]
MDQLRPLPSVSIVIPTLNAVSILPDCLESIAVQDYPRERIEVIVADGGSTDGTLEAARRYGVRICENPLQTGEAGKAVGVKNAGNELVALIDSDNLLPSTDWLRRMVEPFSDPEIIGSEPWEYVWRAEDGFIDRYCALMGMNDPLCYFLGNYDRRNILSGKWTGIEVGEKDRGGWIEVTLTRKGVPTIGANGTVLRRALLEEMGVGDYLADIDLMAETVEKKGTVRCAKVKIGIIHLYCGSNIAKFARKQRRRIRDYLYYKKKNIRKYPWENLNRWGIVEFVLSCTLGVPLFYQALKGYVRKRDPAWMFHPVACWITLWVYGMERMRGFFVVREMSRKGWGQ